MTATGSPGTGGIGRAWNLASKLPDKMIDRLKRAGNGGPPPGGASKRVAAPATRERLAGTLHRTAGHDSQGVGSDGRRAMPVAAGNPFADDMEAEDLIESSASTNPFADDMDAEDLIESSASTNPFADDMEAEDLIEPSASTNPFVEDMEADVAIERQPATIPAAAGQPRDDKCVPRQVLLDMLNHYLRTRDGRSIEDYVVVPHFNKLQQDIAREPCLQQHLKFVERNGLKQVMWRQPPETLDALRQVFEALLNGHGSSSSLRQLLNHFNWEQAEMTLLGKDDMQQIVARAAEPAWHRPGSGRVVAMKRDVMTNVLNALSTPESHAKALPDDMIAPLIRHYGRSEEDRAAAEQMAEQLRKRNVLTVNDRGLLDDLARVFRRVVTEKRTKRLADDVDQASRAFGQALTGALTRVRDTNGPDGVIQRTRNYVDLRLKSAHDDYAKESGSRHNVYPDGLSPDMPLYQQVAATARAEYRETLGRIATEYQQEFAASLLPVVDAFDFADFFAGKSADQTAKNIDKLHLSMAELYENLLHQQQVIDTSISDLNLTAPEQDMIRQMLREQARAEQATLVASLKTRYLANYRQVLTQRLQNIDGLKAARGIKSSLDNSRSLAAAAQGLVDDIAAMRSQPRPDWLGLSDREFDRNIGSVTAGLFDRIRGKMPRLPSRAATVKAGLLRAFRPSKLKVTIAALVAGLGAVGVVGSVGVVSLSVVAAVVLSPPVLVFAGAAAAVGMLGWAGWNVIRCLGQRRDTARELKQIELCRLAAQGSLAGSGGAVLDR